jgi:hypothetical protein
MKIVFNGRAFDSVDQMPPDARRQYFQLINLVGDANKNGVPDVLEQPGVANVVVKESITFNGREYKDRSELPTEARVVLDRLPSPHLASPESRVEVQTKILPAEVDVSLRGVAGWGQKDSAGKGGLPWSLVAALTVVILLLLLLWLSGIRPADLLR